MRIFTKKTIKDFWEIHRDSEKLLRSWYSIINNSDWNNPIDVMKSFSNARPISDNRVIFEISDYYRLVVKINYQLKAVYIRFIGTHPEYDRINAEEI